MTPRAHPHRRGFRGAHPLLRRALVVTGETIAYVVVFALALVTAVLVHLDLPSARQLVANAVNAVLAKPFEGRIVIEGVRDLSVRGMHGADARVDAPNGTPVIVARGVRARMSPSAFLRRLLAHGDIGIGVFDVEVDSAEVVLDQDADGTLLIEEAFSPRSRSIDAEPSPPNPRPITVSLPNVHIRHAWVHGRIAGAPTIDADVDDVHGSVNVDRGVRVDVARANVLTRGVVRDANLKGTVEGRVALPSDTGKDLELRGTFAGTVGAVPMNARADFDGGVLTATADVPLVDPDKVLALAPEAPIHAPFELHARAYGPLRGLDAGARARIGPGTIDASAHVSLVGTLAGVARVETNLLDVQALSPSAPSSKLGGVADVSAHTEPDGTVRGSFSIAALPGVVSHEPTPAAAVRGSFEWTRGADEADSGFALRAHGNVAEPGAPTEVGVELHAARSTTFIVATTHTVVEKLSDVKRVPGLGPGRADVAAKGSIVLGPNPRIDAGVEATIDSAARGDVVVGTLEASASVHGGLDDPTIEASIDASDVIAGIRGWNSVHARTTGSVRHADVTLAADGRNAPDVRGRAHVDVERETTLTDIDLVASSGDTALHALMPKIVVTDDGVSIDEAEITGAGAPLRASFAKARGVVGVRADSEGFDLGAVARVLGIEEVHGGIAAVDVDMQVRDDGADGHARIDLSKGSFDGISELSAHVEAAMEGREVDGSAHAEVPGLGSLVISRSHVHVGGKGPLDAAGWRRAFGRVHLDGQVDLARAKQLFAPDTKEVGRLGGTLLVTAHASRRSETDDKPDLKLSLATRDLVVAGRGEPDRKKPLVTITTPTWQLRGINAALDANANGSSDFAELALRVSDGRGPLLVLDAKSTALPYAELFGDHASLENRLLHLPVVARVLVPKRQLTELPDLIRPEGAKGFVEIAATLDGSALEPHLLVDASGSDVRFNTGPRETPFDARLHATYDGKTADATVDVGSPAESFLHAVLRANADAKELLSGAEKPAWNGSARATLFHFPLGSVTALADRNVRGRASGEVVIEGLHEDARAHASLTLDNLRIGRARYTSAKLEAAFDGAALRAHTRIEQTDGFAEATASAPLTWRSALVPALDEHGATTAELRARDFRAAVLEPFLSSAVDTIDGIVDADAKLALAPGKKPEMTGLVTMREGRLDISALGEELHSVSAKVSLMPDGVVKVQDVVAYGTTGKLTGEASGRLDGMSLVEASGKLDVKKGEAIPLAVAGANMGTVFGRVELKEKTDVQARRANLEVLVPELHVMMPDATPHSVQDLDPQPDSIHIGVSRASHEFTVLEPTGAAAKKKQQSGPVDSTAPNALVIALKLGDVEIRRGSDLAVTLSGASSLVVADKTTMKGQIVLKQGKLDVQGKSFHIQKGTATFIGDPGNPEVSVTASWKGPDGTEVFADYVGPLKTGKVTLRSEPPRPENEIISLIMFGTATGSQATPYAPPAQDTATAAGTAVGAFAAGGLNKGIDKLTGVQITAKVDTGQTNPRPEVEVQIARSLSLELAFVLGTPPPGQNPDTTYATIDWRFVRNWSLATTIGNQGSTMADVLWRYRY